MAQIEGNVLRILAVFSPLKETHPKAGEAYLISDSAIPWMRENRQMNIEADFTLKRQFPIDELHLQEGLRGEIRLPLFSHGELFASLHLVNSQPYRLKEELVFLNQLADYLATPVESYILYTRERQRIDWLTALAHQLRNPLVPIISSSQLLVGELQQGGGILAELARNIYQGANKLNQNLKTFWELNEVQSPEFSLSLEMIDPKLILSGVVAEEMVRAAMNKSTQLVLKSSQKLPQILADKKRIEQALRLLLDNAVKLTPEGGKVELRARADEADEKELIIEVADSGSGFSAEEKEILLQPYRLFESDRQILPDLSSRLAICRRLIELHGGRLWLESQARGREHLWLLTAISKKLIPDRLKTAARGNWLISRINWGVFPSSSHI